MMNLPIITILTSGPSMSIPGPYWLFTILHWLTFTLHLIAMNFLFGGILLIIFAKKSPDRKLLLLDKLKAFPTSLAATITLGVAPLLFLQVIYGKFFYSATIISGWNWFMIVPILIVVYYLLYIASLKKNLPDGKRITLISIAAVGLVYVSYTLTMISDLASKPELWAGLYQASPEGLSLNPNWIQTFFRWGHAVAGAITVAGVIIQLFTLYYKKVKGNLELFVYGRRIFMIGMIKAAILATIYLLVIDRDILIRFLSSPGLHVLLTAIVVNIVAIIINYRVSGVEKCRGMILTTAGLVFVGVFLMVMTRHFLRLVYLDGVFDPARLDIQTQIGPLILFLACFVPGVIVTIWMIKKYFSSPQQT
ncbi:MAG: hypothetical protein V3V99_06525 [candidate division Zixibacteria bacterium]